MAYFTGKKVLIIGGTGSIGRKLLDTILLDSPEVVRIFSRDEHKQFELQQEMREFTNIRYLIGDIRDYDRVYRAMHDIDYVFHVAAMKHVPSCEYNPFEAVQTNIIGTQNVIQASLNANVQRTIFTSTDKAISPTNTYGASKLMAERLIASAQNHTGPRQTVFAAVRFGNVMGSRGSVIPLFKKQILKNREITVTDLMMTRFMMTLKQASDLTIQAMKEAQGGEIFVLKMPVLLLEDLCEVIIEHMTLRLGISPSDIRMKEIGLRPGEKMFEELMTQEEALNALELEHMFVIQNIFLGKNATYEGAKPAGQSSYSSNNVPVITRNEVEQMLLTNGLLEL
ncbi:UDP-N-acetylglucosamine 4,6-dehydratase family protein [Paenibacillus alginolyticus]|uniref:Polysaccharide biosynthesis protein n=1 Tax=Paenibacillus alginolyticus TaxID=59839 RepID=A0ABT4G857_9BACL|nr:UDP-N-acetylglucosamine 4,6-dehydratase family protein [Paenibacillus alginolyticus]MCY9692369.1 polysaccharide biosynthesis protein [Paenibacillus alginolyticus]MEC0143658.1 polysaccharide biosynthesis protein [Paenibacillus alginolyticus]